MARGPPSCFGPGEGGAFGKVAWATRGWLAEVTMSGPLRGEASTVRGPLAGWAGVYGGRGGGAPCLSRFAFSRAPPSGFLFVCFGGVVHRMSLLYVGERRDPPSRRSRPPWERLVGPSELSSLGLLEALRFCPTPFPGRPGVFPFRSPYSSQRDCPPRPQKSCSI